MCYSAHGHDSDKQLDACRPPPVPTQLLEQGAKSGSIASCASGYAMARRAVVGLSHPDTIELRQAQDGKRSNSSMPNAKQLAAPCKSEHTVPANPLCRVERTQTNGFACGSKKGPQNRTLSDGNKD